MTCLCKFDEAFCGCSLKTVSFVFLYASGAVWLYTLTGVFNSPPTSPENLNYIRDSVIDYQSTMGLNITEAENDADKIVYWYKVIAISYVVNNIIFILSTVIALCGIHQNRPAYILPYLVVMMMNFILWALVLLGAVLMTIVEPKSLIFLVFIALIYGLFYYFYLVVYNYYRVLKEIIYGAGSIKYVIKTGSLL